MSLRPQLQGFDLQKMRSFFGSKDERIITAVEKKLAPLWREEAEEDAAAASETQRAHAEIVLQAVMSGVPLPDLAEESDHHYDVARAFAATRQKPVRTELAEWGARTFPDFMERFGDKLPPDCRQTIHSFSKVAHSSARRLTGVPDHMRFSREPRHCVWLQDFRKRSRLSHCFKATVTRVGLLIS